MGYLKSIGTAVIYIGLFLAVVTFLPGLPPDTEFREYSIEKPRDLDPKVGPKNRLRNAERLYVGEITGAESFDSYNGELYTGVHSGYVVRLEKDRAVPIVKFGEKCSGVWQEHKCGRPLGLKFDKKGNLYVADAYYGIFEVDVATGEYKNIVNISKPIEGKVPRIANSVDIAENGDIYWTNSNTDFYLYDGLHMFLANPSGRLIRYNAAKKKNEVLLRDLGFANGVKLSDDESFVIAAETMSYRIMKYNLKGPKAGQHEVFIDGLPGSPDNIHSDGHGGFLVTTVITVDSEHPQLTTSLMPHPYIRKMLVRLLVLMEAPFKLLQDIYPNTYAEGLLYSIGSFQNMLIMDSMKISIILRIDASGNIVEALTSDDGTVAYISSAYIHKGYLWLGSPWLELIRVPLKQAFPDLADSREQSSRAKSERQQSKTSTSDARSERAKRDTESTTAKPSETKPTVAPTPKPTVGPTTAPKVITTAPTTSKSNAAPKASPVPKTDKPTSSTGSNAKSETKPTSESNAEIKKNDAKTVSDAKPSIKSNSPNAKTETKDGTRENAAKINTKSEKNMKVEQDASAKQKAQKVEREKMKSAETNRPRDSNMK